MVNASLQGTVKLVSLQATNQKEASMSARAVPIPSVNPRPSTSLESVARRFYEEDAGRLADVVPWERQDERIREAYRAAARVDVLDRRSDS
jgi:hypothetical protein